MADDSGTTMNYSASSSSSSNRFPTSRWHKGFPPSQRAKQGSSSFSGNNYNNNHRGSWSSSVIPSAPPYRSRAGGSRGFSFTSGAPVSVEILACSAGYRKNVLEEHKLPFGSSLNSSGQQDSNEESDSSDTAVTTASDTGELWITVYVPQDLDSFNVWSSLKALQSPPQFDETSRILFFPMTAYDTVLRNLEAIKQQQHAPFEILRIPDAVLGMLQANQPVDVTDESGIDWNRVPTKLRNTLLPFQREGLIFGVRKNGKLLIGDEMGLGKTVQAIALACYFKEAWPVLVVCPSSVRFNWSNEFERWCPDLVSAGSVNVILTSKGSFDAQVNVVSYDLAWRMGEALKKKRFQIVIVDESHYLKSNDAKRTKTLTPMLHQAKHAIFLTGTPAMSRPMELHSQITAIMPKFLNVREFGLRYCNGHIGPFNVDYHGASNLPELNLLLCRTMMIRRLKDAVLSQLPPKRRTQVTIHLTPKQTRLLQEKFSEFRATTQAMRVTTDEMKWAKLRTRSGQFMTQMFHETGKAKAPEVARYVKDMIEGGAPAKFLLFAHHQEVMDALEEAIRSTGVDFIRIDGSTSPQSRADLAAHFRAEPRCRVALLSVTAAGQGLTLTPCSNVIFAELYWNPGVLVQAEDRVHRIGQVSSVNVRYIVARNTLDDRVWPLICNKLEIIGSALNGAEGDLPAEHVKWDSGQQSLDGFLADLAKEEGQQAERTTIDVEEETGTSLPEDEEDHKMELTIDESDNPSLTEVKAEEEYEKEEDDDPEVRRPKKRAKPSSSKLPQPASTTSKKRTIESTKKKAQHPNLAGPPEEHSRPAALHTTEPPLSQPKIGITSANMFRFKFQKPANNTNHTSLRREALLIGPDFSAPPPPSESSNLLSAEDELFFGSVFEEG